MRRMVATVVVAACSMGGVAAFSSAAGATVRAGSSEFCNVWSDGNQILEDLNEDTAPDGVDRIKRLLKTDVPKDVRKALKKIQKGYRRVADGDWTALVFLKKTGKALATYSIYVAENCDLD